MLSWQEFLKKLAGKKYGRVFDYLTCLHVVAWAFRHPPAVRTMTDPIDAEQESPNLILEFSYA
jgi:hypothetical protein